MLERYLNANFSPKVKGFQSCRRNPNYMASKHYGFKNVQKEFGSSNGSSVDNVNDDYNIASYRDNLSERELKLTILKAYLLFMYLLLKTFKCKKVVGFL